jgi:hypothetical protein
LISRIAIRPSPHPALYGAARDGVFIDAIAVEFDLAAFLARFETCWPEGSPRARLLLSAHRRRSGVRHRAGDRPHALRVMSLSIIIPVLDEAGNIAAALTLLAPLRARGAEIIVVDGGSRDDTRCARRAARRPRRCRRARPGRADECRRCRGAR